jgi:hypothetical protein
LAFGEEENPAGYSLTQESQIMGSAAGFTTLVLHCQGCGERFSVAAATGKTNLDKLADEFQATCPHCNNRSIYPKTAIYIQKAI